MSENVLGEEKIMTLFLKYSVPTIVAMLFLGLNTIVDGLFVGHYVGADGLASVNIAMPFSSFMFALSVMIGIGTQSIVGRNLGAGNRRQANAAFTTALFLIIGIALLFLVIAVGWTSQIAYFLGANEHLMPQVVVYIQYLGLFLPFLGLMMVLDYVLKATANPIYAMMMLLIAIFSHMFFNWLFIAQLSMGIKGAAFATGLGYSVASAMAILPFLRKESALKPLDGRFDKKLAGQILYNGSSEGLTEIGTGITTFLFNITLMRYVGEMGVAAFTVIGYLSFLGNNVLVGLSDGVGAIISYNYGSRQMERVKKVLQLTAITSFAIGIGVFAAIFLLCREIISLFLAADNVPVMEFAVHGARLYAFTFLVNGLNIVASGYFTAIGSPKPAAMIAVSKGILLVGVGIVVLPILLGIGGIWLTVPIAELFTVLLSLGLIYRQLHCPLFQ